MPGSYKTEAVVLRSIRYGEADRIIHLYTRERGRVNAIAKGSRRPRSRYGGRLEPFFQLDLILHEGRSDLHTVTGASTINGYPRLRESGPALNAAARACDAVLRLLDSGDPNQAAYNLLCRYLTLLDGDGLGQEGEPSVGAAACSTAAALAFRIKLALAAGFAPELASCARCGEREGIVGFSGSAGGVVCGSCEGAGFRLDREAHEFMVAALGKPLAALPLASSRSLQQAERAIGETLSHHAHVHLRAA